MGGYYDSGEKTGDEEKLAGCIKTRKKGWRVTEGIHECLKWFFFNKNVANDLDKPQKISDKVYKT